MIAMSLSSDGVLAAVVVMAAIGVIGWLTRGKKGNNPSSIA